MSEFFGALGGAAVLIGILWLISHKGDSPYRKGFRDGYDFAKVEMEFGTIKCKDCKWFNDSGCAIRIVDDSDKPKENDFCSFAERRDDGEVH